MYRLLVTLSRECQDPGEYVGPAWGLTEPVIRVRCSQELPEAPAVEAETPETGISVTAAEKFLDPIPVDEKMPDRSGHSVALTVGRLVHKAMELWRFSDEMGIESVLQEAFRKILMQADDLNTEEQHEALDKAVMLLTRFRDSSVRKEIEAAEKRWHELPFSFSGKTFTSR